MPRVENSLSFALASFASKAKRDPARDSHFKLSGCLWKNSSGEFISSVNRQTLLLCEISNWIGL